MPERPRNLWKNRKPTNRLSGWEVPLFKKRTDFQFGKNTYSHCFIHLWGLRPVHHVCARCPAEPASLGKLRKALTEERERERETEGVICISIYPRRSMGLVYMPPLYMTPVQTTPMYGFICHQIDQLSEVVPPFSKVCVCSRTSPVKRFLAEKKYDKNGSVRSTPRGSCGRLRWVKGTVGRPGEIPLQDVYTSSYVWAR